MKVLYLTNEYPPNVYGGAGVHIEYLSREMTRFAEVEVRTFGDQDAAEGRVRVRGMRAEPAFTRNAPEQLRSPLSALSTCLSFNSEEIKADVVHCHTWYTHFGGILAKHLYGTPFVLTVHSLEPMRPWKREQLGRGYDLSSWIERRAILEADAVVAVSESTREDVLRVFPDMDPQRVPVIHNGIDIAEYTPDVDTSRLEARGIDPGRPYVLFVGRMTRQKGLYYLLRAAEFLDPEIQLVLCAGGADTAQMQTELEGMVTDLGNRRGGVIWIPEMLPRDETVNLFAGAAVFCCPSIYEPFGIINLEAMSCGTAVVASSVGGIPEVVVDGETGILVDPGLSQKPPHDPADPEGFAVRLAEALNAVAADPSRADEMGAAGRIRVEEHFSWAKIAEATSRLYERILR